MRVLRPELLILAVLASPPWTAAAQMKLISEGKAIQIRTDEFVVRSETIGREFLIEVTRPDTVQPGRKTAVIYATDGGSGIIGAAARMLMADGKIPRVHVVSIGYPNERGRHVGPRQIDLTHGQWAADGLIVENGGGAAFEAFILNDIRPFIEARYPVDPARAVLFGHSMGGLFVANVLAHKPDAFAGYLIGGVPPDARVLERVKAAAPLGNGRRVFVGYAPDDVKRLHSDQITPALTGPGSTFKVLEQNFTDEKHNSEILMLVAKGFRFLLPTDGSDRVAITLKPEVLERYVGAYRINANQAITITREGTSLFAKLGRALPVELFAESDTAFFARAANAQVAFIVDGGKASRLVMNLNDLESSADRIP